MYLKTLEIKNYRSLNDVIVNVDKSATLIVGRNNTGKTSFMEMLHKVLKGEKLCFNDYPLSARSILYQLIDDYAQKKLKYNQLVEQIPKPSMKFTVDYLSESTDQILGALSPFIIDMDISTTTAIIFAEYCVVASEEVFDAIISNAQDIGRIQKNKSTMTELIRGSLIENFDQIFSLTVSAINPTDNDDTQLKTITELKNLFPLYLIRAERGLDESDATNTNPLSPILSRLFQTNIEDADPQVREEIESLRDVVKKANKEVQNNTDDLLCSIVQKSVDFGYPNGEDLQLKASTVISIDNQITNQTDLTYVEAESLEELPNTYNGLGYKNLIKIEFALAEFSQRIKDDVEASIPLLFLEEPESHMHPQLQQTFVKYLEDFLNRISDKAIQVFITTHSSHIANTVPFNQIRYAQKKKSGVKYKDLSYFCAENKDNALFIQKYLTLSRCDLFFADKAILIEGAAERLLIPDMIEKCAIEGVFENKEPKLPSQYYALVEVGGAYAHKFLPFINFLEIPTLVLTDIDSILSDRTKSVVSIGKMTSNATIQWWIKNAKKLDEKAQITLEQVTSLTKDEKTIKFCHIEYQTEENGLCGRSLEESIINVNRTIFSVGDSPTEKDIQFKNSKKTDFALQLMIDNKTYNIPAYIKCGLAWLDSQKVLF